jgi:superfamily II DNA helicase RecQ
MPAYVVFGNATLETIARRRPSSRRELAQVKGVGPKKLEQYGEALLEIVRRTLTT